MQKDMHYYGTYSIARCAGVPKDIAIRISKSAQYVDDSNTHDIKIDNHPDGGKFATVVTAHTTLSGQNLNEDDQRLVWVPFHFIPGNEGDTFSQRLTCRKNSDIARQMMEHHLSYADGTQINFGPELVGIGMHVFSDTFAHYGFSGVSSRLNRVKSDTLKLTQPDPVIRDFLGKTVTEWFSQWGNFVPNFRSLVSDVAEDMTGGLGHGGVSLYPDCPFLEWEYEYEFPELTGVKIVQRNNLKDYMEAIQNMWEYFTWYADKFPETDLDEQITFEQYKDVFEEILKTEGNMETRIQSWKDAADSGRLGFIDTIPEYDCDIIHDEHELFSELASSSEGTNLYAYRFHQAATIHRDYVAKVLLPLHNLVVW